MSRPAWITPDEAGTDTRLISVRVPDDEYLYSCLIGAVLLLTESWNWEGIGALTPDEVSALFLPTFQDLADNA
jgi:hypothetical protein